MVINCPIAIILFIFPVKSTWNGAGRQTSDNVCFAPFIHKLGCHSAWVFFGFQQNFPIWYNRANSLGLINYSLQCWCNLMFPNIRRNQLTQVTISIMFSAFNIYTPLLIHVFIHTIMRNWKWCTKHIKNMCPVTTLVDIVCSYSWLCVMFSVMRSKA